MNTPETKTVPANLLVQSHIEIVRILHALAREHCRISADFKNGHTFTSHLLSVDPGTGHFTIAYSASKLLNAMLLGAPATELTATDSKDLHFSFEASTPEETLLEGQPAIQFALPKALLLHNRRDHARISVPDDISLRCIADEGGFIPFESHITDISHDGLGCLIYDPEINLEDGTILHGCRIILPSGDAVVADIELRHATTTSLPNGALAKRAGFRFLKKTGDLAKVAKQFMRELGK